MFLTFSMWQYLLLNEYVVSSFPSSLHKMCIGGRVLLALLRLNPFKWIFKIINRVVQIGLRWRLFAPTEKPMPRWRVPRNPGSRAQLRPHTSDRVSPGMQRGSQHGSEYALALQDKPRFFSVMYTQNSPVFVVLKSSINWRNSFFPH